MFWNRKAAAQLIKRQTLIFGSRLEPPLRKLEQNSKKTIEECNKNQILRICDMMLEQVLSNYPVEYLEFCVRRTLNKVIGEKKILKRIIEGEKKNDGRSIVSEPSLGGNNTQESRGQL